MSIHISLRNLLMVFLQLVVLVLTVRLAAFLRDQEPRHDSCTVAGTDMFWELHDRNFPSHYLPDGRVICTEEQASQELEKLGLAR